MTVLKDGFAELAKIIKDNKRPRDDDYNDWLFGLGSTRELDTVENKPNKKVKLASYNIPGPIKTTQLESNNESSNLELNNHSLSKNEVTAIVAVMKAGPKFRPKNNCPKPSKKKVPKKNNPDSTWQWIWWGPDVP